MKILMSLTQLVDIAYYMQGLGVRNPNTLLLHNLIV